MADLETTGCTAKRKAGEAEGSSKKRQKTQGLTAENPTENDRTKSVDSVPPVSYKLLLEEPLPRLPDLPELEKTTQKTSKLEMPGMGLQYNYGKLVMRIIEALPDHQLQLSPAEGSDNTPTTSTDSGVGAMHNQISDTCNAILSQWPGDEFIQRWRIRKKNKDSNGRTGGQLDSYLELTYDKDGRPNPKPVRLMALIEERWQTFSAQQPPEVIDTGKLDLWEAYDRRTLSEDGRRAFLQAFNLLRNDEQIQLVILYTPVVLWLIVSGRQERTVAIVSEPFTASSQHPTMKQAVFAMMFRELMYARKEMEGAENWLEPYLDTPPETLPWSDDDDQWQDADVSAREILTSAAADGETEGDQLLRELEDTDPPRHGNSLVRIGRVKGDKVAAKIVRGDAETWIIEEIENEGRAFKALKSLQGLVIPEVVFFGKVNCGKDWLLVTKFLEGLMIDEVPITEKIAANARSSLQAILDQGCVHGDEMPRNIFVTKSGGCIFIDLGRTKRVKDGSKKKDESMRFLNHLLIDGQKRG